VALFTPSVSETNAFAQKALICKNGRLKRKMFKCAKSVCFIPIITSGNKLPMAGCGLRQWMSSKRLCEKEPLFTRSSLSFHVNSMKKRFFGRKPKNPDRRKGGFGPPGFWN